MMKVYIENKNVLKKEPIQLKIVNLGNTQDSMKEYIPMSCYPFVNQGAVREIERLSQEVMREIKEVNERKQKDF